MNMTKFPSRQMSTEADRAPHGTPGRSYSKNSQMYLMNLSPQVTTPRLHQTADCK